MKCISSNTFNVRILKIPKPEALPTYITLIGLERSFLFSLTMKYMFFGDTVYMNL